jgi:hypothetical protein
LNNMKFRRHCSVCTLTAPNLHDMTGQQQGKENKPLQNPQ